MTLDGQSRRGRTVGVTGVDRDCSATEVRGGLCRGGQEGSTTGEGQGTSGSRIDDSRLDVGGGGQVNRVSGGVAADQHHVDRTSTVDVDRTVAGDDLCDGEVVGLVDRDVAGCRGRDVDQGDLGVQRDRAGDGDRGQVGDDIRGGIGSVGDRRTGGQGDVVGVAGVDQAHGDGVTGGGQGDVVGVIVGAGRVDVGRGDGATGGYRDGTVGCIEIREGDGVELVDRDITGRSGVCNQAGDLRVQVNAVRGRGCQLVCDDVGG